MVGLLPEMIKPRRTRPPRGRGLRCRRGQRLGSRRGRTDGEGVGAGRSSYRSAPLGPAPIRTGISVAWMAASGFV